MAPPAGWGRTFAVQIARALGGKVTASCSSGAVELVRSLGADEVIDYTVDDPIDAGRTYDLVVNIGGTPSLGELRRTLNRQGTLAAVGGSQHGGLLGPGGVGIRGVLLSPFVGLRLRSVAGKANGPDLETLATMIEEGEVTPVIDRTYPLSQTPDAMRNLETGHPSGKIVVTVADGWTRKPSDLITRSPRPLAESARSVSRRVHGPAGALGGDHFPGPRPSDPDPWVASAVWVVSGTGGDAL